MEREQLNFYLQQVSQNDLDHLCSRIKNIATIEVIQKPTSQTLMVPVKDPINNGSFFGGEVLVTSAIVRVNYSNGWSMVLDENGNKALSIAILDGAYSGNLLKEEVVQLALVGRSSIENVRAERNARVHSTKVSFDLL